MTFSLKETGHDGNQRARPGGDSHAPGQLHRHDGDGQQRDDPPRRCAGRRGAEEIGPRGTRVLGGDPDDAWANRTRTMLFDFGFSEIGAAYNARTLGVPMGEIEAIALSHGHGDHRGGFRDLVEADRETRRSNSSSIRRPSRPPDTSKFDGGKSKSRHPAFTREMTEAAGTKVVETKEPRPMLGGDVLFLGEIPRRTAFETGLPNAFYEEGGVEKKDSIDDDTSLVMNLKGKGLIVLSGCAHSGIINTVDAGPRGDGDRNRPCHHGRLPPQRRPLRSPRRPDHRCAPEDRSPVHRPHALHGAQIDPADRGGDARELPPQHVGDAAHLCGVGAC